MLAEQGGVGSWLVIAGASRVELLLRLLLAMGLGGAIGLERELSDKPAGFRTNILICMGAALFTEMSVLIATVKAVPAGAGDPTRIAAQIVSGMGFLGAGTILQARGSVRGLTTAATLWTVAAIGMTVGAGAYIDAIGATVLVIMVLVVLGRIERLLIRRVAEQVVRIELEPLPRYLERVEEIFAAGGFVVETLEVEKRPDVYVTSFRASGPRGRWRRTLHELLEAPGVRKVIRL
jgi:putative Mg2+ transporter-C (MgtC) family protein